MDVAGVGRRITAPYPRVSWPSSLEGLVRSLEQPQRLGLLLVCPFLGGRSLCRPLLTPMPGRASGSDVSRIPGFVFPLGSRPFDHRQASCVSPDRSLSSNDPMCGSDEVRCTPKVALPPLMDTMTFRSSGSAACSSASSERCGSCSASLLASCSSTTAAAVSSAVSLQDPVRQVTGQAGAGQRKQDVQHEDPGANNRNNRSSGIEADRRAGDHERQGGAETHAHFH